MADAAAQYQHISPLLLRDAANPNQPVVLLTCGLAGSGKTTLAKTVVAQSPRFSRLSNDEIIAERHGLYGVDYAADDDLYLRHQEEADGIYLERLDALLREGKDVVLDGSLWQREDRDAFKKRVEDSGGRWVLVYFKVGDKEALWQRIQHRSSQTKSANSALDISRDIFDGYWNGFEEPVGEGELVFQILPAKPQDQ